jgi:hypothetical protein
VSDILAKYEKSRSERRLMLSSDEFQAYLWSRFGSEPGSYWAAIPEGTFDYYYLNDFQKTSSAEIASSLAKWEKLRSDIVDQEVARRLESKRAQYVKEVSSKHERKFKEKEKETASAEFSLSEIPFLSEWFSSWKNSESNAHFVVGLIVSLLLFLYCINDIFGED